jgi:hypothetical protein
MESRSGHNGRAQLRNHRTIDYASDAENASNVHSRVGANPTWTFIAGFSAAKIGDLATAQQATTQLHEIRTRTERDNAAKSQK